MADWNVIPDVLLNGGWVTSIGGQIAEPGGPTCIQADSLKEYDYAVASSQWIVPPQASLYEPWSPSPHTAVIVEMPFRQPNLNITMLRKPKTFPAEAPFGPYLEDDKPSDSRGFDLHNDTIDCTEKAVTHMYNEIETELAIK